MSQGTVRRVARIEDYALIGDTQTGALISKDGSIDWLCLPRFDAGACFAALLGTRDHGRWRIAPAGDVQQVTRRYRGPTLILETEFTTASGVARLTDFMPPRGVEPDLVRIVEGVRGEVEMDVDLVARFDYGSVVPWVRRIEGDWTAIGGPDSLSLRTPVDLRGVDLATQGRFTVRKGERVPFVLTWHRSHEPVKMIPDPFVALSDTEDWWQSWVQAFAYEGRWKEQVLRSAITLKALTFAPTGGIVAALTTSLPEQLGGVRNWDYRFCWLRDATFTLFSLIHCGFHTEAAAWRNWLLRAAAGDPSKLQTMYGAAGERRLPELILDWLPGYEGSQPVRIGNAAVKQFQLDVYGEVLDALHVARVAGLDLDASAWALEKVILEFVAEAWREPDEGIWEVRGPRRHFTHSKVLAWVAFDRAIKAVEMFGASGPVDRWRQLRHEIHEDVCRNGFNQARQTFTQYYGSDEVDASLLQIPLVGFLPIDDPRVTGTVRAIEKELQVDGFVRRYHTHGEVDGLPEGEGAFLACTFWLADAYVLQGRRQEAESLFENLLALTNDVGLLAEQYDPGLRRQLGNFPQAFSHVSLINTARNIANTGGPAHERSAGVRS
ncbi:MAG TPA: glycoside hydrolase family 15 protein [Vicinamibacterales bacterium]|nr:glycoside hydrolase family 15 protein [Vicinamibacterales bacterium]